jgi:hypothetical protein
MGPSENPRTRALPERDTPEWAAWHAATRIVDVEYVGKMEAVVFRFGDGRIFGVPVRELEGADPTPVRSVSIECDGDVTVVEQFSGNRLEVPWDVVLYRADPTSPYRSPEPGGVDGGAATSDRAFLRSVQGLSRGPGHVPRRGHGEAGDRERQGQE